jgi:membrane protein implicated in regulation of membrane protease activity
MKVLKIFRIIFGILTIISGAYTVYSLFMVWGDKLLYYNVEMGHWLAVSYKWSIVLFSVLLLTDIILSMVSYKKKRRNN